MKLYKLQSFLDSDGWTARDFSEDKEWTKVVNGRAWFCRIHYSSVEGYYMEVAEVGFLNNLPTPYLVTGKYRYAMDDDERIRLINEIKELPQTEI